MKMYFFGGFLFMRLGGFVRFLYGTLIRKTGLSNSRYYTLSEYIHGSESAEDEHWDKGASHEFVNRVVGIISALLIILAVLYLDKLF